MQQFAVLAFMHGASGHNDKATQLIRQARDLAGSLFDDFTLSSASGFLLMSLYFQVCDVVMNRLLICDRILTQSWPLIMLELVEIYPSWYVGYPTNGD